MPLASLALGASLLFATPSTAQPQPQTWGGPSCPHRLALRGVVDDAFAAAPAGDFFGNGRGSGAAGYSVALSKPRCGVFRYAVGQRNVEDGRRMTPRTLQHIGSLTKILTGVVAVRLAADGAFGPDGLEATVDGLLSDEEIALLTVGDDPDHPRCPAEIIALNRSTQTPEPTIGLCPQFSQIRIRHLLNGNHGLFDFINEVDRNANGFFDAGEPVIGRLLDFLGVPRLTLPEGTDTAFELLAAHGLLANPNATLGGTQLVDFESSFGNTGYILVGILAERVTGLTFNQLLESAVSSLGRASPPRAWPIQALSEPPDPERLIARQYFVTSNAELVGLPEDLFGLYPLTEIAGNPAISVYDLEAFIATGGGAAGSVVATPNAYRRFFRTLVRGNLLNAQEQALFNGSFVSVVGLPNVEHGFGVFRFDDPEFGPGFAKSGQVTGSGCQLLHFETSGVTVVACRNSVDAFLGSELPNTSVAVGDLARELVRTAIR